MTELLLLDSSAAVAMLQADHPHHPIVARRVVGNRIGLAGHAVFETYSALTRMPVPRRIAPGTVARLMAANFPETRYSSPDGQARLFASFVDRGITGGALFDALVAGTAAEHGAILISCDRRAARVYEAVGTRYEIL